MPANPQDVIRWDTTSKLYEDITQLLSQFPDPKSFLSTFADRFDELSVKADFVFPCKAITRQIVLTAQTIYKAEQFSTPPPHFSPALVGTLEGARYRDSLLAL